MFKSLYKLVVQVNPDWQIVFTPVGICMIVFPILFSFLFYCVVNGFPSFAKMSKTIHWVLFLMLSVLLVSGIAYGIANAKLMEGGFFIIIPFVILNAVLTGVLYVLASFIFKRWSLHSLFIPFKWTPFFNNK